VQNCAQIDRKCTLFRPKTPFFAHFCRGEGRLFGRPKNGVFGGSGGRASGPAQDRILLRKFSPDGSDGRIATLLDGIIKKLLWNNCRVSVFHTHRHPRLVEMGTIQQSGLADRPEAIILSLFFYHSIF
jgi:hypothetical protein